MSERGEGGSPDTQAGTHSLARGAAGSKGIFTIDKDIRNLPSKYRSSCFHHLSKLVNMRR